jgi:hypothetical protein
MAHFTIDHDGLTVARRALAADAETLSRCALELSAAAASARAAAGTDAVVLGMALERFRLVEARALDAIAAASAALGGRLDVATLEARDTDLAVASALGRVSGVRWRP